MDSFPSKKLKKSKINLEWDKDKASPTRLKRKRRRQHNNGRHHNERFGDVDSWRGKYLYG